jgi:hypothetical protein
VEGAIEAILSSKNRTIDRRKYVERRLRERRKSMRYSTGTLIVVDSVTWLDDESDDRRRLIRRRQDRKRIAARILELRG